MIEIMEELKRQTITYLDDFFCEHENLRDLRSYIEKSILLLKECQVKNKIMVCGNGGSTADSEHIAGELLKSFMYKRPIDEKFADKLKREYGEDGELMAKELQGGIKCIPLTSFSAFNFAYLNDNTANLTFAQLVNVLGETGDVLFAISTSGNSKNVIYACQVAKLKGIKIIGLTGQTGGKLKEYADVLLNVPSRLVWKIQEMHLPIYHLLCLCLEAEIFEE